MIVCNVPPVCRPAELKITPAPGLIDFHACKQGRDLAPARRRICANLEAFEITRKALAKLADA